MFFSFVFALKEAARLEFEKGKSKPEVLEMIVRGSNVLRFLIMTWMFFVACWQEAMFKAAHAANAAAATEVPPDFSLEAADGPMAEEGEEEEGGQDDEAVDAD